MSGPVTETHLNKAYRYGERRALREQSRYDKPLDDVFDDDTIKQDLIFTVTDEKIDPESADGWLILDAYEDGYYTAWEEVEDKAA